MNLNIRLKNRILKIGFLMVMIGGLLSSCQYDYEPEKEVEKPENIYISTSISMRDVRSATLSEAEERINSIRLIVCDTRTGEVLYNVRHQPSDFTNQPQGVSTVWHSSFAISPGDRDFFFIANEDSWNLTTALIALKNKRELYTQPAFTHLVYDPAYKPTLEKPMILTQAYFNVKVESERNGKGTRLNPQHFVADGDEEVDLVRSLSKIKLTVKEVVHVEEQAGVMKPTKFKFKQLQNFQKLTLGEIPKHFALFKNPYFNSLTFLNGQYYTTDFYGTDPSERQELTLETAGAGITGSEVIYTRPTVDTDNGLVTYYDYVTTVYAPEFLRPYSDAEKTAGLNPAGAMTWRFYNNTGTPYYKSAIDHQTWELPPGAAPGNFVTLPEATTRYSRYSVLRNSFYDITAEERGHKLFLKYDVKPWVNENYYVYVGDYYNVWIEDPTFTKNPQKLRIVTSRQKTPVRFGVKLTAATGQTIQFTPVGTAVPSNMASHNDPAYQTHSDYMLNLTSTPSINNDVILIKFNDELVYTIKKQNNL